MAKHKEKDLKPCHPDPVEANKKRQDVLDDLIGSVFQESKRLSDYDDGESEFDVIDYFDTGCILLNCQLSGRWDGGCPDNKILMLAGVEASGKSYVMKNVVASAIKKGYAVVYFDTEGELKRDDLEKSHGIPASKVLIPQPPVRKGKEGNDLQMWDTINLKNKWLQMIDKIKPGQKIICVLDSLSNLPSPGELESSLADKDTGDMGQRNKQLKAMFRSISSPAAKKRIPIVVISHVYKTIGTFSTTEISAGTGAKYNASMTPLFTPKPIKVGEGEESEVIGIQVKSHVKKNRLAKPFTTIYFDIYFDGGMDRYSGLLEYAEKFGFLQLVNGGSNGKCMVLTTEPDKKIPLKTMTPKKWKTFWDNLLIEGLGDALNKEFRFSEATVEIDDEEVDEVA